MIIASPAQTYVAQQYLNGSWQREATLTPTEVEERIAHDIERQQATVTQDRDGLTVQLPNSFGQLHPVCRYLPLV